MPVTVYKVIHLTGVLMVFLSMGGLIFRSQLGEEGNRLKRLGGITNGVGMLLALVGGFGLLAKLSIGFPGWVIAKLGIWIIFGGLIAVANRKPELSYTVWFAVIFLGATAAYLAGAKPF